MLGGFWLRPVGAPCRWGPGKGALSLLSGFVAPNLEAPSPRPLPPERAWRQGWAMAVLFNTLGILGLQLWFLDEEMGRIAGEQVPESSPGVQSRACWGPFCPGSSLPVSLNPQRGSQFD